MEYDLQNGLSNIALLPAAVNTSTATGTGVDISAYHGKLKVILDTAIGTGTSPTLDVAVQTSDTLGSGYVALTDANGDAVVFAQVTDAAAVFTSIAVDTRDCLKHIRVVGTITGSATPTFTCSVNAVGQLKTR